jgi:uncharacterized repeat protein (TIGR01451 family)
MKKQLGILASLVFFGASALLWTGCSGRSSSSCEEPVRKTVCEPVCEPKSPPKCAPRSEPCPPRCAPDSEPVCMPKCPPKSEPICKPACEPICPPSPQECVKLKGCTYPTSGQVSCNGVTVTARNPKMCMLGDQYPLEFDIKASEDVCDVIITTTLPEGVTFIRSTPEAKLDGRRVIWNIGHMDKGQCIPAKVWLRCEREGEQCVCFCVKATPVSFCALLCAKPVLCCEKVGPAEVCPGDPVHYTITVTNVGSCTAEDVVVVDNFSDGLEGPNCEKSLTFKLGSLEPCQTKKVNVCLKAVKRGKVCNSIIVTACNANQTSCEWCTLVACCNVECTKVGPKEQNIGKNADYQITVTNSGDKMLTDVIVTDNAPACTSIVAANGATIRGNQAIWKLRELKPGEKMTFNLTLTTCTPGYFVNRVNVASCQGCTASCEFGTQWKGRAALNVCLSETEDSICVGDTTRYEIEVVNQGQEYDTNVRLVLKFPDEIDPISGGGATDVSVSTKTVTFAPFANLAPRQTIKFYVDAKAKKAGDARVKAEVSSDSFKTPITQEESTIVN